MIKLINASGGIHPALIRLAYLNGLTLSNDVSPRLANQILNSRWIQKHEFRYQIQGRLPSDNEFGLLREIGCVNEIRATLDIEYDGVLLLGAILHRVRSRLAYLTDEYRHGLHFRRIFLLGSNRRLDKRKESPEFLLTPSELPFKSSWKIPNQLPLTEIDMMRLVAEQSDLPQEWEIVPISCPDVHTKTGIRHANTGDTILWWQKYTTSSRGHFLVASNQPFVQYQKENARRLLPKEIILSGVGPAANPNLPIEVFLDNLTKQLYEEIMLEKCTVV